MIVLHGPVSLHGEGLRSICEFTVSAGERMPFVLTYCPSHLPAPAHIDPEAALAETEASWAEWSARGNTAGEWSDAVKRSLVTLKALTYAPTGGIVAAPRSEEHTSELQSLMRISYAVFCLKKKNTKHVVH